MTKLKIYEHIHSLKNEILKMQSELSNINNDNVKKIHVSRMNLLIESYNTLNFTLESKLKTDVVDTLIYTLMQEIMQQHEVFKGNAIPLGEMQNTFEQAFNYDSDHKRQELVSMLKSHEKVNIMKKYKGDELAKKMIESRSDKEWIEKLEEFATSYKRLIKWHLKN